MRLEARVKMGYYPTPTPVVDRIRTFLSYPAGGASLLDPCCGEGAALRRLAEGTGAATYGIEPDDYRAGQAGGALDHVLHCGYEDLRASRDAFSCLFLNPPYDWQDACSPERDGSERTEKVFLQGTVRYLMPGGVLVYIVPQPRMTGDVAKVLCHRFEGFNTYRFPDGEYERFRQVIVFGKRKGKNYIDEGCLGTLGMIPHRDLPEIPLLDRPVYEVPASGEVRLFRSSAIDEAELERELASSVLWEKLDGHGGNNRDGLGRPPLPLHTGHLGLLLASGCLDGTVGTGEDRHVVRGKVEKITHTEQEYEGDVIVEREVERYRVSIKVLTPDGEIRNLM
jgi:hypothetical protein